MIEAEPKISAGILDRRQRVRGRFEGRFSLAPGLFGAGEFEVHEQNGMLVLKLESGETWTHAGEMRCQNLSHSTFTLHEVIIGIGFHWERAEEQTFQGDLRLLLREEGSLTAINEIPLEDYLASVISSEMSATAPLELLKAHAITSRSWLVAMLARERNQRQRGRPSLRTRQTADELIRWYDREDHDLFEVCADDHCQRYQGVTKMISAAAAAAVAATRGMFLVHENAICDARFSKACGGLSENFENCWEETAVPYLRSIPDAEQPYPAVQSEDAAERWMLSKPAAFCNTDSGEILRQILPAFDQETADFFRWTVSHTREELEEILRRKAGFEFGTLLALTPLQRGPSGRIVKLKITGSKQSLIVGKELEIRRWLSPSHLYSSAFIVQTQGGGNGGAPEGFTLHGAGWGHGVGLCQIGAAVMATKGFTAEEIVQHYFRGAQLKKLY